MSTELHEFDSYKLNTEVSEIEGTYVHNGIEAAATQRWFRKKLLGKGAFGSVWLQKDERGMCRAVKQIPKDNMKMNQRELHALVTLGKYPQYFVQFTGWFQSEKDIYLAMEYIGCGDLQSLIGEGPMAENDARKVAKQLLEGTKILHQHQFCHRDLKPQNVLVTRWVPLLVKIADFGISKQAGDQTVLKTAMMGTIGYAAPEVLDLASGDTPAYTTAVDIWSLGCIVYAMLTQETPFPDTRRLYSYIFNYASTEISFPKEKLVERKASAAVIDFIATLITPHPENRATAEEALKDPWLIVKEDLEETLWGESLHTLNLEEPALLEGVSRGDIPNNTGSGPGTPEPKAIPPQSDDEDTGVMFPTTILSQDDTEAIMHPCITAYCSIKHGNLRALKRLCQKNRVNSKNVNARQAGNTTLLHMAINSGDRSEEMVKMLLEKGASLTAQDGNQRTPFALAALNGRGGLFKLMLKMGADINLKDVNLKDTEGWTQLHRAVGEGWEDLVKLLLGHGADINARNGGGMTPLHLAVIKGRTRVAEVLPEKSVDTTTKTTTGKMALNFTARCEPEDIVRLLLEHGADINTTDEKGITPLHSAIEMGHVRVVEMLLENGAGPTKRATGYDTVLHLAAELGSIEIVQLLLEYGSDINAIGWWLETPLYRAVKSGRKDVVRLLLENEADTTTQEVGGSTALHLAATSGSEDIVRLLLEYSSEINAIDLKGETPLYKAVEYNHTGIVRLLLENRADTTIKTTHDNTVLHHAAKSSSEDIVMLLLEYGSDANELGRWGETPLLRAADFGRVNIVKLLLENEADIDIVSSLGRTAPDQAARKGHKDIISSLEKHKISRKL